MITIAEPFRVLCADPPWSFGDKLGSRGALANYSDMTVEDICRVPLPPLHDDAALFMWRVASMPQEALDVIRAWGFIPKTEIVWLKKNINGNRWFGMGRIVRAEHEICIVATRGRPEVQNHSTRSAFLTEFGGLSAMVGRHSEKPEEFYRILESLYQGPYCELFARRKREGWTCLGDDDACDGQFTDVSLGTSVGEQSHSDESSHSRAESCPDDRR